MDVQAFYSRIHSFDENYYKFTLKSVESRKKTYEISGLGGRYTSDLILNSYCDLLMYFSNTEKVAAKILRQKI